MTAISIPVPLSPIGTVDDNGVITMGREWYRFFGLLQKGVGGDTTTIEDIEDNTFTQPLAHADFDTLRRRIDELAVQNAGRISERSAIDALRRRVDELAIQLAARSQTSDSDVLRRSLADANLNLAQLRNAYSGVDGLRRRMDDLELLFFNLRREPGPPVGEVNVWTPTLLGSTGAGTPVYVAQEGYWVQIRRLNILTFYVQISATTGMTGNLQIGGLPVPMGTVANTGAKGSGVLGTVTGLTHAAGYTAWSLRGTTSGTSVINVNENGSGVANTGQTIANTAAATTLAGSFVYFT